MEKHLRRFSHWPLIHMVNQKARNQERYGLFLTPPCGAAIGPQPSLKRPVRIAFGAGGVQFVGVQ